MEHAFSPILWWFGLSLFYFLINIPLGYWRYNYKPLTVMWFLFIHASVPVIIVLRILLNISPYMIPINIILVILGQFIGIRIHKHQKQGHTSIR